MKINKEALEAEIECSIEEIRDCTFSNSLSFAIFEENGIQVSILVTKDEDDQFETVVGGLVEAEGPGLVINYE